MSALMPTYARSEIALARGEGAYVWDTEGRRYLDFAAGIAVSAFGHSHPHLNQALKAQADKIWHTSNMYRIPEQERLAERLCAATFADMAFFTNSGAEAIECALKTTRRYHWANDRAGRFRIITFAQAFHGRTLAAIAATNQEKLQQGFAPLPDWFDIVALGDFEAVRQAIGPKTAAIMIEPLQGEGGIRLAGADFLAELRDLADEHGLLLIYDEIQCGMGRTGKLFAYEHAGVAPDVLATAKGIGGGFPLGACLTTARVGKTMTAGSHGSTYGGNPLACAVGNAALDLLLADGFLAQVSTNAEKLRTALEELAGHHEIVKEIRGLGLMLGIELGVPARDMLAACRDQGLLSAVAGEYVLRLLPPLIIGDEEIEEAIRKLDAAADIIEANQPLADAKTG